LDELVTCPECTGATGIASIPAGDPDWEEEGRENKLIK